MIFRKLLIVFLVLVATIAFAQVPEESRACQRLKYKANEAMGEESYADAVEYFLQAEAQCQTFGIEYYERFLGSLTEVLSANERGTDAFDKYNQILLRLYDTMDQKGIYNENDDIVRGYYETLASIPDYKKADKYLSRGIKNLGRDLSDPYFITLFYFNTYTMWSIEENQIEKTKLKTRLIKDYFELTDLVKAANFRPTIIESLNEYLSQVILSCQDLTSEIPEFIASLPEDKSSKKNALWHMINLMKEKKCQNSNEYNLLIETIYNLDPEDKAIQFIYIELLPYPERIPIYKEMLTVTTDDVELNAITYQLAYSYFQIGALFEAYNSAQRVEGAFMGKAHHIMAQCVASTADMCGDTILERKSNFVYAIQLLERAKGYRVSGLEDEISRYNQAIPDINDCNTNDNLSAITLSCWKVSVNPCP